MALRIEDYALVGDLHTAALIGADGSVDWLCLPRFDSGACFAALLGEPAHGRWLLAPALPVRSVSRRYRPGTLVLETEMTTDEGTIRIVDAMPPREQTPHLVRLLEGVTGSVRVRMELVVRFESGTIVPWVRQSDAGLRLVAGPDALCLRTPVTTRGQDLTTVAEFTLSAGERVPFVVSWHASHVPPPRVIDADDAIARTESWWREWSSRSRVDSQYGEAVQRSLVTLKAMAFAPTGGIIAAPTSSLPEQLGGPRNWDYRYCWLRDATFTLYALMLAGYTAEAQAWRDWLLRTVAGDPAKLQIMYGVAGERRLPEFEADWLPGYEHSRPVRFGNAAAGQFQLDVYGEIMDALHLARRSGLEPDAAAWDLQLKLLEYLEDGWRRPDDGLWEMRGPRRQFTHSKVMAWVAFDRAVKAVERFGEAGPVDRWRTLRAEVHAEVCRQAYDTDRRSFTQSYGSTGLDASVLMIPLVGFLPPGDERVVNTIRAIERELVVDGFVRRYPTEDTDDGVPGGEGAFLACTFWLADNLILQGRHDDARALFERLLSVRNDVGLLSEEYDPGARRLVGNFPQVYSHVGLVNTAYNLRAAGGAAHHRADARRSPSPRST